MVPLKLDVLKVEEGDLKEVVIGLLHLGENMVSVKL